MAVCNGHSRMVYVERRSEEGQCLACGELLCLGASALVLGFHCFICRRLLYLGHLFCRRACVDAWKANSMELFRTKRFHAS